MRMKSYSILMSLSIAFLLNSWIIIVAAQPYYDAYFTSIMVTDGNHTSDLLVRPSARSKVYDGQPISINITSYNNGTGMPGANLYVKLYIGDVLVATSNETYVLIGSSMVTQLHDYEYGAKIVNYKAELWWNSSGTQLLEDEKIFSVQVVKLFVTNWSPASLSIEKDNTTASTWSINFTNGGNDVMYNTSISVVNSDSLQVYPQSISLGTLTSQSTQSTSFSVVAPSTSSTGNKTVPFEVSCNDFEGNLHFESKVGYVIVSKLGSSITVSLIPSSAKKGDSTKITARLLDGNGNPIASQPIIFSIGTTSIGSANTNSSGNAVKPYTVNVNAGTYVVSAFYSGNEDYASSNGTNNLVVNPFATTLTIDVPSVVQGRAANLKATLKDENGSPLQNMSIEFQVYEGAIWTNISSADTDSSGVASIDYTPSSTGLFKVKAVYAGSTNYAPSSSISTDLNVGMDYTLYYIGGAIVVVIVASAIGYWVFRARRKKTQKT